MSEVRCDCGKELTAEERHYYGHSCEACERRQMGREDEADRQSEVEAATARTLELVVEWLRKEADGYMKNLLRAQAMSLRIAAQEIDSGAFAAWLKEREGRGG